MTTRGKLTTALGVGVYVAAWAFGSRPLYPIAVGLLVAVALARAWVRLAAGPVEVRRSAGPREALEGDDVTVETSVRMRAAVPPPSLVLVERIARVGELRTMLQPRSGKAVGCYVLEAVSRGRYTFEDAQVVVEDPFGLQRAAVRVETRGALLVYPRLVELTRLFSESGSNAHDGRRMLLRRPSGFDLHSVREYEQGESLRKVHWPTTARRGLLMVKELEDAPRDEVAVLLDADASAVVGESFDVQVRAAGSLLRSHARRGRRAVLIVSSAEAETRRVHSGADDWRRALELLAAVEPSASGAAASLLAQEASPAARALELAVVTATLAPGLVDRLVQRAIGKRSVSLVYVDAASFAGRPGRREPALLRLRAAGVPVALVRQGDDLRVALAGAESAGAVGA